MSRRLPGVERLWVSWQAETVRGGGKGSHDQRRATAADSWPTFMAEKVGIELDKK